MKHMIYCVIGHSTITDDVLNSLSEAGYKGTVIPSTSLKNFMADHDYEPMFINLAHFDVDDFHNNTTIFVIEEEDKVPDIIRIIREHTGNWKKCNGCVCSFPIANFEGSF